LLVASESGRQGPGEVEGSKLAIMPQSGHIAFLDQPNLYIKTVADFLKGK
jgi:pimeloyl-ACP methyl ester carboxylesterase